MANGFDDVIFDYDDNFDIFDLSGTSSFDLSDVWYFDSYDDKLELSGVAVGYGYDGVNVTGWFLVVGLDDSAIGPEDFIF